MAFTVTCPKCHNVVTVNSDAWAYLNEDIAECPLCDHVFKMKFVRFFDEQRN